MLEYLESLLTGTGHDLDLRTFKLVDQLSGRMLGVRADITPQVARIDAHLLNRNGVTRLCYAGSVLHAQPSGLNRTREPLQIGAEIYGHAGRRKRRRDPGAAWSGAARPRVWTISISTSATSACFAASCGAAGVERELESELFRALQSKDVPALARAGRAARCQLRAALLLLPELYGGAEILQAARAAAARLSRDRPGADRPGDACARSALTVVSGASLRSGRAARLSLSQRRGVRRLYAGHPNAIALGGRYDEVGKAFGRARPATGFSMDLRELVGLAPRARARRGVLAPLRARDDESLQARSRRSLRARGEIVIVDLARARGTRGELRLRPAAGASAALPGQLEKLV